MATLNCIRRDFVAGGGEAVEALCSTFARDGSAEAFLPRLQTRANIHETIRYHEHEEIDGSILRAWRRQLFAEAR